MSRTPENTENRQAPEGQAGDLFDFLRPMAEDEVRAISRLPDLPMREAAMLGQDLLFRQRTVERPELSVDVLGRRGHKPEVGVE